MSDSYHREVLGGFLLDLEADKLDDEAYLNLCRKTGRLNDLIERLLKLRKVEEAEDTAKAAEDYSLFKAIEVFVKFKQADLAEKIIMERLDAPINENGEIDYKLVEWLAKRFKERGDFAGSLRLEERIFWKHPNIERFKNCVTWQRNSAIGMTCAVKSLLKWRTKRTLIFSFASIFSTRKWATLLQLLIS